MPNTAFYIEYNGVIFELDATTDFQIVESGTSTDYPIEDGSIISDHYFNNPTRITCSGVISSDSFNSNPQTPESYISLLKQLKRSGNPFNFHYTFDDRLPPITTCVLEEFRYSNSVSNGITKNSSSYRVELSIKQIKLVTQASIVAVPDVLVASTVSGKTQSGKTTQQDSEGVQKRIDGLKDEQERNGEVLSTTYRSLLDISSGE